MWKAILSKLFKAREKIAIDLTKTDEEKPFLEHLEDLRTMLVRIAVTLLVAMLGGEHEIDEGQREDEGDGQR